MFVRLDDGSKVPCAHPGEANEAKQRTGLSLGQLRREGRIHPRWAAVCTDCRKIDYYDKARHARARIRALLPFSGALSDVDLYGVPCSACTKAELRPLTRMKYVCSQCGEGSVRAKIWGMS